MGGEGRERKGKGKGKRAPSLLQEGGCVVVQQTGEEGLVWPPTCDLPGHSEAREGRGSHLPGRGADRAGVTLEEPLVLDRLGLRALPSGEAQVSGHWVSLGAEWPTMQAAR